MTKGGFHLGMTGVAALVRQRTDGTVIPFAGARSDRARTRPLLVLGACRSSSRAERGISLRLRAGRLPFALGARPWLWQQRERFLGFASE
jgi:hypothetical protein